MKLAAYWINFPRDQEYRTLDYVRREVKTSSRRSSRP